MERTLLCNYFDKGFVVASHWLVTLHLVNVPWTQKPRKPFSVEDMKRAHQGALSRVHSRAVSGEFTCSARTFRTLRSRPPRQESGSGRSCVFAQFYQSVIRQLPDLDQQLSDDRPFAVGGPKRWYSPVTAQRPCSLCGT
ncbi:hypothetical protein F2P81_016340 [Scophthalmus maximus]|uniref:Uncharacterized protein n=1 Tax=Scophthalmus maximus TaxID=52904 RepID=A0A6A4SGP2_SCOMX|nr:hypothetical protein F2P81_016340 [Scophthalmus maximus]